LDTAKIHQENPHTQQLHQDNCVQGALKLTSYLFSVGRKMYKRYKRRSEARPKLQSNIGLGYEDDVDDDGCETDLELMVTGANLTLQLEKSLESRSQHQSKVIR